MIRFLFLFLATLSCFVSSARALDMRDFKALPVLHDGRLKPLDSFARNELKAIGGRGRLPSLTAIDWLAETLFAPGAAVDTAIFDIPETNLRHSFGVEERAAHRYSFAEIVPGLKRTAPSIPALLAKDRKDLTSDQRGLLDIHDRAARFVSLMRSLSLLLPLNVELPGKYAAYRTRNLSYLDLKKLEQEIAADVKNLTARKGEDIGRYTADEKRVAILAFQLQLLSSAGAANDFLKIVPPQWATDDAWHAPWEILRDGAGAPQIGDILSVWRQMGAAFNADDDAEWRTLSTRARNLTTPQAASKKLRLEVLLNTVAPFRLSLAFYAAALVSVALFFTFANRLTRYAAVAALGAGLALHAGGLGVRMFLLMRPPVGTLYESLIFVSALVVALSLVIEGRVRNGTGLLMGSLGGLGLGLVANAFAHDGDTLETLTAVLNTNFWLATHVLCITLGYGWCVLTAIYAHLYLSSGKFRDARSQTLLHTLCLCALLFTAIGTVLGGIWADQSWGRFWGWDPKENGALLIVLWLIWLLHGKLGGELTDRSFIAGLAFTGVIVSLSWIGVNLLGVGMHSYGFADGLYYGLGGFVAVEAILIFWLWKREPRDA